MNAYSRAKALSAAAFVGLLMLLAGCLETKQEFTLNPDGSGKVVHESKFLSLDSSETKHISIGKAKAAAAKIIREAQGVEAWRDVSYEVLNDGRIVFKGTAYFRSLNNLVLPQQTVLDFSWTYSADGSGSVTLRSDETDQVTANADASRENSSTDELVQTVRESRTKLQEAKSMLAFLFRDLKHEVVFRLPGTKRDTAIFQVEPAGTVRMQYDGSKFIQAWEALLKDDDWLARNAGRLDSRGGGPPLDERISELMFGDKGPVRALVTGMDRALFDYEAEVTAVKDEYAIIQDKLGPFLANSAYPPQGTELKSLKVVGVRLIQSVSKSLQMQPFYKRAGYTLVLLAELPDGVHAVSSESSLKSAIASDGSDLLPDSDYARQFRFPELAPDKKTVLLEADLKTPASGVTGLKELTGHLRYLVAGKTVETDLGFSQLTLGAKGTAYDAEIISIGEDSDNGMPSISLLLALKPEEIRTLYLVVDKERIALEQNSFERGLLRYTYKFISKNGFPPNAKLLAESYSETEVFDTPFRLENITLLGEPTK